jgi:hypothetical protein
VGLWSDLWSLQSRSYFRKSINQFSSSSQAKAWLATWQTAGNHAEAGSVPFCSSDHCIKCLLSQFSACILLDLMLLVCDNAKLLRITAGTQNPTKVQSNVDDSLSNSRAAPHYIVIHQLFLWLSQIPLLIVLCASKTTATVSNSRSMHLFSKSRIFPQAGSDQVIVIEIS